MMGMMKKIFNFLSDYPAFTNLFKKAVVTGRVNPIEVVTTLAGINPAIEKGASAAMDAVQNGGNLTDVANAMINIGEVPLPNGLKIDTKTLIPKLKETGGFCASLANAFEILQKQKPSDVADLGEKASNINWKDILS